MRTGLTIALALTLIPSAALAHPGHGDPQGLLHGLAHPPGSLDHTMAMVVVGMLAFMLGTVALYAGRTTIVYASRLMASTRATWRASRPAPSLI
jgi:hydrogenase/urease accessory protein HupE